MSDFISELEAVQPPDRETLDRMLERTKGRLFFGQKKATGFLGSLLCDHRFVWDDTCTTAWCNGDTIGWNPRFFVWLTPDERVFVLAHELWHTGFDHMGRLGKERCPDIWNKAADYIINNMLEDHGFVAGPKLRDIVGILFDRQYDGMTTEQVYDLLPKPPGKPQPSPNGAAGSPGAAGQYAPTQDPGQPMHGDLRPVPGGDTSQGREKVLSKIVKAVQTARMSKEAGDIPGEIEMIVDKFLNPILPWEVLLMRFFTELSNDDYSWKRPSRRYDDEYLPSLMGENGLEHLIYYLDVSGSVSDADVLRFNSEVKYIHETLQPQRLTLVTFDTKIQDEYEFEKEMPFEKIVVHGRGGTSLDPVRRHIEKHKPTAAVVFSDLYVHPMEQNPGVPVLWVCVGNKQAQVHFGQLIHIDSEYHGPYGPPEA